jgi:hypothetical protein
VAKGHDTCHPLFMCCPMYFADFTCPHYSCSLALTMIHWHPDMTLRREFFTSEIIYEPLIEGSPQSDQELGPKRKSSEVNLTTIYMGIEIH